MLLSVKQSPLHSSCRCTRWTCDPHQLWNASCSEPVLVWLSINIPTGSNKSALFHYLYNLVTRVRERCGYTSHDAAWLLGDATCEKMGDLMATNGGRLLGLYDELSSFLTQLNLSRGKGLTHSHELALFLQLYNGHSCMDTYNRYVAITTSGIISRACNIIMSLTSTAVSTSICDIIPNHSVRIKIV